MKDGWKYIEGNGDPFEKNHKNLSCHRLEVLDMQNRLKVNRKLMNTGGECGDVLGSFVFRKERINS